MSTAEGGVFPAVTDRPAWAVIAVFDPDGGGSDFAYTVGLAQLGFPELHVWARPPEGEDPGEDWILSPRDCAQLLNSVAARLLREEILPGLEFVEPYDGGLTQARFRVGRPCDAESVEAYQLPAGTAVLPLRWSLHRPRFAPAVPLSKETAVQVRQWVNHTRRQTRALASAVRARSWDTRAQLPQPPPPAWRCPPEAVGPLIDVDHRQRFGPLHQLVVARAEQLLRADRVLLDAFTDAQCLLACGDREAGRLVPVLAATARSAGRSAAVTQLEAAVGELVELRLPVAAEVAAHQRELLRGGLRMLLIGELLADVLGPAELAWARGPWAWTVSGGALPGRTWVAPPGLRRKVRSWIVAAPEAALIAAGQQLFVPQQSPEVLELLDRLHAWRITGQGSPSRRDTVPTSTRFLDGPPVSEQHRVTLVQLVARRSVELLAFGHRLTDDQWSLLAEPLRRVLPGLPQTAPPPPAQPRTGCPH